MVTFSVSLVNCQNLAVAEVTLNLINTGTVCGTVDQTTANYICTSQGYGNAIDYGRAGDKG